MTDTNIQHACYRRPEMVSNPFIRCYHTDIGLDSATCSVWFDISRTNLPRPFRFPATEDAFIQIRADRKWFKNLRLFPSELPNFLPKINECGHIGKDGKLKSVLLVQPVENEIPEHFVIHPSPHRAFESLPSFTRTDVSQEIAVRAIKAIAEICGLTVDELREICGSGPVFIDSLDLDLLLSIEIINTRKAWSRYTQICHKLLPCAGNL